MAERFFLDKGQPIKATPYLERLQNYIEAHMPPETPCMLCGNAPIYTGAGMVDGVRIGYHLCEACWSPGWIERITAKVRGDMFLRRCN